MIPTEIERRHILKAIEEIDSEGYPKHRSSYRYDLEYGKRFYPPKYVISIASRLATGTQKNRGFNAVEAKNWFLNHDFKIVEKSQKKELIRIHIADECDESSFPEGAERFRMHRSLERDSKFVRSAKARRLRIAGELRCDVCNMSFVDCDGDRGRGFIEAHHTIPVSQIRGKSKTRIEDLALVCSNCHRMLHREPLVTVRELATKIRKALSKNS